MIKIMADSTCDLSQEILDKYDISLASLTINIEEKVYADRVDIKPDYFYSIIEELEKEPTTAMPNPIDYLDIMKQAVELGYSSILCICMSSGRLTNASAFIGKILKIKSIMSMQKGKGSIVAKVRGRKKSTRALCHRIC